MLISRISFNNILASILTLVTLMGSSEIAFGVKSNDDSGETVSRKRVRSPSSTPDAQESFPLLGLSDDILKIIVSHTDEVKKQSLLARSCKRMREVVYSFPYSPHRFTGFITTFPMEDERYDCSPRISFIRSNMLDTVLGRKAFYETVGDPSETFTTKDTVFSQGGAQVLEFNHNKCAFIFGDCIFNGFSIFYNKVAHIAQDTQELVWRDTELTLIPDNISLLEDLTTLNLSSNKLKVVSPHVASLRNLTTLNLALNNIIGLTPRLGMLSGLQTLNLEGNELQSLPGNFEQLVNLKKLILLNNNFVEFPIVVTRMKGLEDLDISNLNVTDASNPERNIVKGVYENTRDGSLISYARVYGKKSINQIRSIPEEVKKMTGLRRLGLAGNPLETLPNGLLELTELRYLDISRTGIHTLLPGLKNMRKLKIYTNEDYKKSEAAAILRQNG